MLSIRVLRRVGAGVVAAMTRNTGLIALLAAEIALSVVTSASANELPAATMDYAVKISTGHDIGSGVVVVSQRASADGTTGATSLILTCDHVLTDDFKEPAPKSVLVTHGTQTVLGVILYEDKALDLAYVGVASNWPAASPYLGPLQAGEQELIVGYPLDTSLSITTGYISAADEADPAHREGSAPAWPGNSGGGVYIMRDGVWKLAGIAKAVGEYDQDPAAASLANTVSYFITIPAVQQFMAGAAVFARKEQSAEATAPPAAPIAPPAPTTGSPGAEAPPSTAAPVAPVTAGDGSPPLVPCTLPDGSPGRVEAGSLAMMTCAPLPASAPPSNTVRTVRAPATPTPPDEPSDFQQGLTDRRSWEQWYSGLTGDYQQGAEWWSAHRSLPNPPSCGNPTTPAQQDWNAGCLAAQQRLAASDVRRKTDPTYRQGWNSY